MNELAACSKVITLHGFQSRQPRHSYTHHRGIVNCLSINHNNKVVASCGQDGKIFLVNADKPEDYKLAEYSFYSSIRDKLPSLTCCAFSHNSKYIAVGAVDSVIKVWDLRGNNLQIKSHMGGITSLAWIKNQKNDGELLASASSSGDIFLNNVKNNNPTQNIALKLNEGVNCIRVSEGETYCRLAACTNAGSLSIWDLMVSKQKPAWTTSSVNQTKASLTSLAFSSFSPVLLVTASVDESMVFYDIREKKSVKVIATEEPLSTVGLHSNGHILSAGGMYGTLFVYDLRNPSKPQNKMIGHQTGIKHLQFFKIREKENAPQIESKLKPNNTLEIKDQVKQTPRVNPMQNNYVGKSSSLQRPKQQPKKQSKIQERLSTTAKELLQKHSQIREQLPPQPKDYEPNLSYIEQNSIQRSNLRPTQDKDLEGVKKEIGELKSCMSKIEKEQGALKGQLYEMEERLTLTIVKQFQLQQQEFKRMLESMSQRERQKDERIASLQEQNKRLKNTTF